jgi:antitoxin HicB
MTFSAMAKARSRYNIMLRPEPEGGYTALVPALPGCVTHGRTVDEAREMARDKPRQVIRFLEQNGFALDHTSGRHFIFYPPSSRRRAVVPVTIAIFRKGL